ncbi:hypothetical protein [Tardiphaga sp.]|nr:hypothetical protein [Tardiphaga sp.]MDB5618481.1 hypothetical protein [Tardiphaga sp.]
MEPYDELPPQVIEIPAFSLFLLRVSFFALVVMNAVQIYEMLKDPLADY